MQYVQISPGEVGLRDGPVPVPGAGEALVRVDACGLCASDLKALQGMVLPRGVSYPLRPGHEVAGRVEQLGQGTEGIAPGESVVLHPLLPCGRCAACLSGLEERCTSARVLGLHVPGGMAPFVVWPVRRMVRAAGLDPAAAALLPDAVATAYHAVRMAGLHAGSRVCVIGAGGLGYHVVQLARALHRRLAIAAVVKRESSASRLREMGVRAVAGLEDAAKRLRGEMGRFDVVVDFSGAQDAPAEGLRMLDVGGLLILGSIADEPLRLETTITGVTTRELRIAGCYVSSLRDLEEVVTLSTAGGLDLGSSVSRRLPLGEASAAFQLLADRPPGMVRVVLEP